jgi:hypothetical protein
MTWRCFVQDHPWAGTERQECDYPNCGCDTEADSSSGQDGGLSIREPEFDSPISRQSPVDGGDEHDQA